MTFARLRRAVITMGWLATGAAAGVVCAAENLPPLSVDPALLGGAPPKPAAPSPAPQAAAKSEPTAPPPTAPPPSAAAVTPVAPPPAARPLPATPAAQPKTQHAAPSQSVSALRVDPALLDGSAAAAATGDRSATAVATETRPPQVAEQPKLPPLYSAHVAAGVISHPSTTPFATAEKGQAPTRVTARSITGVNEVEVVADGDAYLERNGDTLQADRITYRQLDDEVEAVGNVRLASPDTLMTGPRLRMRMEESTGEFEAPVYNIKRAPTQETAESLALKTDEYVLSPDGRYVAPPPKLPVTGSGHAERLEFRGEDQYHMEHASFSTCSAEQRDWELKVDSLDLDYAGEEGSGRGAVVDFKNVPIFYMPWMSFPLNNHRKSGFLPATIGSTDKNGLEVTLPWYWNIAPNMDATITPREMTKRGLQLNSELRYLDYDYQGQARVEYLPSDQLAKRDRYGYALIHNQNLGNGFGLALNVNGVSDDNYFSDLSTRVAQVTQGNLLRQGVLSYGGPWYSAAVNVQSYQTLVGNAPYQRLPQITATANRYDLPRGLAFNMNAEYVAFDHPTAVLGKRTTLYPSVSLPLQSAAFFLTPKLGLHMTRYELERQAAGVPDQITRTVPVFSTDAGVVMERTTDWFGQSLVQTLEPRAYYLYVPRRSQQDIPVFDTALADFSYAQLFSENRYAGGDRIGDANQLTLAVTSRLIDPASGAEYLRGTLGQLYYFEQQQVTLPGEVARVSRKTDLIAALSGQVLPRTYADFAWQYNPRDKWTERLTLNGRYQPAYGKVFNAGYRYTRDLLGQLDVSAQWPIFGGWNAVGRYNYSLKERRVIESIGGMEYDAGCWIARFVVQRLATIANKPTNALFVQLELKDFSRIGSSPLDLLKRSIPGYGVINQPTADPIFGAE